MDLGGTMTNGSLISNINETLKHQLWLPSWEFDFLTDMKRVLEKKDRELSDKEKSMIFKICKKMNIFR